MDRHPDKPFIEVKLTKSATCLFKGTYGLLASGTVLYVMALETLDKPLKGVSVVFGFLKRDTQLVLLFSKVKVDPEEKILPKGTKIELLSDGLELTPIAKVELKRSVKKQQDGTS